MNDDPKDSQKKTDLFDPEKKIADETSDSLEHTGWLQDEKWSIQFDNNRAILLAGAGGPGGDGDGGPPACKSCGSCGGN